MRKLILYTACSLDNGEIDEMILAVHPIILGRGIPLFLDPMKSNIWVTKESKVFDSGLLG